MACVFCNMQMTFKSRHILIALYQFICFAAWAYLAYCMSHQYLDNSDASQVAYKKFNKDPDSYETYPTFSICFLGLEGTNFFRVLVDSNLEEVKTQLLRHPSCNESYNPNRCIVQLMQNILLGKEKIEPPVTYYSFNQLTDNVLRYIDRLMFEPDNYLEIDTISDDTSMHISYQDPLRTCITKKHEMKGSINVTYDLFGIDPVILVDYLFHLEVYVHQKGELIQQLGKLQALKITSTDAKYLGEEYNKSYNNEYRISSDVFHEIHVRDVEILRKRHDAVVPCDKTIDNNDMHYKKTIMNLAGCIPFYWKLFNNQKNLSSNQDCHEKEELLKIGQFLPGLYENINVGKGLKLYDPPCRETTVLAITHRRRVVMDYHRIFIVVHYDATHFKEITNNRAFTTFDLWSQIGGFVGIFLGYSCLQVI